MYTNISIQFLSFTNLSIIRNIFNLIIYFSLILHTCLVTTYAEKWV